MRNRRGQRKVAGKTTRNTDLGRRVRGHCQLRSANRGLLMTVAAFALHMFFLTVWSLYQARRPAKQPSLDGLRKTTVTA